MKSVVSAIVGIFLLIFMIGCGDDGPDIDVESAVPVSVEEVTLKPIKEFISATGTLYAKHAAELKAEDRGGFYKIQANPRTGKPYAMGDSVVTGDLVVKLDNPEYVTSVQFKSKKINYDISKREFEKQKGLYEKGGVTLRELSEAEQSYINAEYSLENARIQLSKLSFVAPFNGIIVDLPYYSDGTEIPTGSTIVEFMSFGTLYSEISLPAGDLGRLEVGQDVEVVNYTHPEDTLIGAVLQVSPALDPTSRTFKATVLVENPKHILKPGMFAKIDVVTDAKDSAIVIPKDVITEHRGSRVAYIVQQGVAVQRKLDIGIGNKTEVEILGGLEAGERLVVNGFETLRNRSRIKVVK